MHVKGGQGMLPCMQRRSRNASVHVKGGQGNAQRVREIAPGSGETTTTLQCRLIIVKVAMEGAMEERNKL